MASVGGTSVTAWPAGNLAEAASRSEVETYIRDGVPDRGLVISPVRGRQVEVVTILDVADATAAVNAINAWLAMIGTGVTVVDQHGVSWSDVQVLDSRNSYAKKATAGYRVTTAWTFLTTP